MKLLLAIPELIFVDYEIESKGQRVVIKCKSRFDVSICPRCNVASSSIHENHARLVRDVPLSGKRCFLSFYIRRFKCEKCLDPFAERFDFIELGSNYTNRYKEYVYNQCNERSLSRVSEDEGLDYDAVEKIYYDRAHKQLKSANSDEKVKVIGIDEISRKKGHEKMALIYSIYNDGRNKVREVLKDRKKETLDKYFGGLNEQDKKNIKTVSIDMWKPYYLSVKEKLPHAKIVVDRFHVMQNLNKAITSCRREIQQKTKKDERDKLKGFRWVLVTNRKNLDDEGKKKLKQMYEASPELKNCHQLKEEFRAIFDLKQKAKAKKRLEKWMKKAERSGLKSVAPFIVTLKNWKKLILNYFDGRITNGPVEGFNNKVQLIKRRAFGYRNHEHFRGRILQECNGSGGKG